MKKYRLLVSLLVISFSLGVNISNHYNQQQIKVKNKQIEELQKQVSRQTKRIAELTGNGG